MTDVHDQILVWEIYYTPPGGSPADVQALYFSTVGFATAPDDTPPNTFYDGRIIDPGSMRHEIFQGDATNGRATSDYGFVEVANSDGAFDFLYDSSFGHVAQLKALLPGSRRIDTAVILLTVAVIGLESGDVFNTIRFRVRDRMNFLDNPALAVRYGGGGGMDGGASLDGVLKPRIYGNVFNIAPLLVDDANLVYQVSNSPINDVSVVRDGGAALTSIGDQGNYTALVAASIPGGSYGWSSTDGFIRLGAVPQFEVTANVTRFASNNCSNCVRQVLQDIGLDTSEFDETSFAFLTAFNDSDVGIYVTDEMSAIDVISYLMDGIGASLVYGPSTMGDGQFQAVWLYAPTGIPPSPDLVLLPGLEPSPDDTFYMVPTFTLDDIIHTGFEVTMSVGPMSEGNGRPVGEVVLKYGRNWRPQQTSDLSGVVVGTDLANTLGREWSEIKATASAGSAPFFEGNPLSLELTFESSLFDTGPADAEASRRVELYSVRRDRLSVPLSFAHDATFGDVEIGQQVRIKFEQETASGMLVRFGYGAPDYPDGKPFIVLGREDDYKTRVRTLILWG